VVDEADLSQQYETLDRAEAIFRAGQSPREEQLVVDGKVLCLGCGEPIPVKRLIAMPDACRCVECQRDLEE
jgi:DnaK suppressor protein